MRLARRTLTVPAPVAMAIGNFDGMHRGHVALLEATVRAARNRGLRACALCFDPLPREFFARARHLPAPARLMSLREKWRACERLGLDDMLVVPFDDAFARQSADEFIAVLSTALQVRWLTVGRDFRFGAQRRGSVADLVAAAEAGAFVFAPTADVHVGDGRASSTATRTALANGDLVQAAGLLGRPYSIVGRVVHGAKRGRQLGFPTANVALGRARAASPPLWGVYAVKLRVLSGALASPVPYDGAASLGRNPAVKSDGIPSLEVHVFEFAGDLYGARVEVEFHHKIRDEARYSSLDELIDAIGADCAAAKRLLDQDRRAIELAASDAHPTDAAATPPK